MENYNYQAAHLGVWFVLRTSSSAGVWRLLCCDCDRLEEISSYKYPIDDTPVTLTEVNCNYTCRWMAVAVSCRRSTWKLVGCREYLPSGYDSYYFHVFTDRVYAVFYEHLSIQCVRFESCVVVHWQKVKYLWQSPWLLFTSDDLRGSADIPKRTKFIKINTLNEIKNKKQ